MMQPNLLGTQLAKVLYYYGLVDNVDSDEIKIVCPFHEDINPSMKVNLQDGSWYCFGCNKTGDAFSFVKNVECDKGLNDLQAAQKFYKILKSKKTEAIKVGLRTKRKKNNSQSMVEAKDYYYNLRTQDWTIRPDEDDVAEAILYMKRRGFSFKVLTKCGCKYTYNKSYPLIFPMLDNGEFKGWVCRTTTKHIEEKRKYLYNEGFSRRDTLCGSYKESNCLLYVVEGYMDMLKLRMFGINNVVAILGWKATNEQITKLKKAGIKKVVSALDNDVCGRKGTEYLKNYFEVIRFEYDEDIKDPGDMTKSSFARMNKLTIRGARISKGDK